MTPPKYSAEELARLEAAEKVKHEFDGKEFTLYELTQEKNRYARTIAKKEREIEALEALGEDEQGGKKGKLERLKEALKVIGGAFELLGDFIKNIGKTYEPEEPVEPLKEDEPLERVEESEAELEPQDLFDMEASLMILDDYLAGKDISPELLQKTLKGLIKNGVQPQYSVNGYLTKSQMHVNATIIYRLKSSSTPEV